MEKDSQASKKLETWLPLDVFQAFTAFCKAETKTGLGKFDYGVGLRLLLMKAQYADYFFVLDERLKQLEIKGSEEPNHIPKGWREVSTLKDIKFKKEAK